MSRNSRFLSCDLIRLFTEQRFVESDKNVFRGTVLVQSKIGRIRDVRLRFTTDQEDAFEIAVDSADGESVFQEFEVRFCGSHFGLASYELQAEGKIIQRALQRPDMIRTPRPRLRRPLAVLL